MTQYETSRIELLDGTLIDRHEIRDPQLIELPTPPGKPASTSTLPIITPIEPLGTFRPEDTAQLNQDIFVTRTLSYQKWIITRQHETHPHGEEFVHFQDGYYINYLWKVWVPAEAAQDFEAAFNQAMEISEIG
jgi:hypothetical protein